jgi:hypothetical protein
MHLTFYCSTKNNYLQVNLSCGLVFMREHFENTLHFIEKAPRAYKILLCAHFRKNLVSTKSQQTVPSFSLQREYFTHFFFRGVCLHNPRCNHVPLFLANWYNFNDTELFPIIEGNYFFSYFPLLNSHKILTWKSKSSGSQFYWWRKQEYL